MPEVKRRPPGGDQGAGGTAVRNDLSGSEIEGNSAGQAANVAQLVRLGRADYAAARRAVAELTMPELERLIEVITRVRWRADRAMRSASGCGLRSSYLPEDLASADYYALRIATMAREEIHVRRWRAAENEARAIFAELAGEVTA